MGWPSPQQNATTLTMAQMTRSTFHKLSEVIQAISDACGAVSSDWGWNKEFFFGWWRGGWVGWLGDFCGSCVIWDDIFKWSWDWVSEVSVASLCRYFPKFWMAGNPMIFWGGNTSIQKGFVFYYWWFTSLGIFSQVLLCFTIGFQPSAKPPSIYHLYRCLMWDKLSSLLSLITDLNPTHKKLDGFNKRALFFWDLKNTSTNLVPLVV